MISKRFIFIGIIILVGTPFTTLAQNESSTDLSFAIYGGGSFSPSSADHISANYYDDLRFGFNFGGQADCFFSK